MDKVVRRCLIIAGQVQGVGFRPFVYRLAQKYGLSGLAGNTSAGVRVEIQGPRSAVEIFCEEMQKNPPPLALIKTFVSEEIPVHKEEKGFAIAPSSGSGGHKVLISPDMATCDDCLEDINDPQNRRNLYPFTNCTNCGPRFTITRSIPYDRATTSMSCFAMCPACLAEYENPLDRRFHAQPNACPECGPELFFRNSGDSEKPGPEERANALEKAAAALAEGRILALKGLGGFHLACDALNEQAVQTLRRRKTRPHKPLAVMTRDLAAARELAFISPQAEELLTSPQRPIVLCPQKIPLPNLAPDAQTIGLMLPYTPLHHILLKILSGKQTSGKPISALVMTSGNAGGDPICLGNREALNRLKDIADAFLLHNRDILVRVDDSVAMPGEEPGRPIFFRRARGYVPSPLTLGVSEDAPAVMGLGAELKTTICLNRGNEAFVSQHIGDLQNHAVYNFYQEAAEYLIMLLQTRPRALVCDQHPDYLSTAYAEASGLPVMRLQHHFAHAFSVLAENEELVLAENKKGRPVLALALDGTGLGEDQTVWGGELLLVNMISLEKKRLGRLSLFSLPGGEAAIREPWRIALALLAENNLSPGSPPPWLPAYEKPAGAAREIIMRKINCPPTSSCGRLFDAVSALAGLCLATSYEGQAAIRLEQAAQLAGNADCGFYEAAIRENSGLMELDSAALFTAALEDLEKGVPVPVLSRRFHLGLAKGFARMAAKAAREHGAALVGLSGGVMQNRTLAGMLRRELLSYKLTAIVHKKLPPNDACISFGQLNYGIRAARF